MRAIVGQYRAQLSGLAGRWCPTIGLSLDNYVEIEGQAFPTYVAIGGVSASSQSLTNAHGSDN
ncbi:hypothetical protein ETAA8_50650 [Anatilimnocola aggregata]|uniref:Uncharacterized protein n=1 Tax=Anatilimnocola aggregata TaxID=2528021 RepID=A0A517YI86_9BACT|nr:hypothetical protein ETAA8_50650 [Anatilimnocola aggregata]